MPIVREKKKIRVQSLNAGQDSTSEPAVVKAPFASVISNGNIDSYGKIIQRLGLARVGDNPATLISSYSFDASDSTDDKGSNDGADTSITYVDGKFGKCASFNGTTSLITVTADSTIDFTSMGASVITAWVYPDTDGENDTGAIFTKGNHYAHVFGEAAATVKVKFVIDYGAGTDAVVETSTTMSTGAWHKVELHYNADESLDVYIDGSIASYDTDTTGSGTIDDDSSDDLIIGNNSGATKTFDGEIDDFRVYDGTRSSDEYEQDKIMGMTRYKVGSSVDRIYRIRDTNLERLDDDFLGYTVIDPGFTADKVTNFVQAKDILFILNGTENVHTMDSSESVTDEADTNTDPPKTTVGAWAQNNRLFLSGSLTESERDYVWFSDSLAPQTFDRATNVFKVRSGTSGKITWLQTFKLNELIIYKEDSIFVLDMTGGTPLDDWTVQSVNVEVGCKAGRTVQDIGNDQIFLDNEGSVRLLTRTTFDKLTSAVISGPVENILKTINIDAIDKSCSWFVDEKYYLAFPTGTATECDRVVIWDANAAQIAKNPSAGWTALPQGKWYPAVMSEFEFGDNELRLVVADNRGISMCFKHTGNTDNGEAIDMDIAGPDHDFGNRGTDKIWGPLHVVMEAGENTTATIYAEIDRGGAESLGTLSLSGNAPTLPIDLPFNLGGSDRATDVFSVKQIGRGKTCRIWVEHKQYNQTATFIEYELYAEERIPRPS